MKTRRIVCRAMRLQNIPVAVTLSIALFAVRPAIAADPDPAKVLPSDPEKMPQFDDAISRPAPPPSLLPDEIPQRPKRTDKPNPKPEAKTKQDTAADMDLRVRYRKARNIAETTDKIRAAWEQTRYAKCDQDKRDALRRYYDLLFAKMVSMDRGIAPLVEERQKAETFRLTQTRIAPTVRND